ncbi:MAG: FAD-binding protein [Clostridiales bacterium]|nr:FAD-binding protein [Clostridiales bacterium]
MQIQNLRPVKEIRCDILITGACYSGMWAAWKLAGQGFSVVLMEKSWASLGGCARFAGGDIQCYFKEEDDLEAQIDHLMKVGCGLGNRAWIRHALTMSEELMIRQQEMGIPFVMETNGKMKRRHGRGGIRSVIINPGKALEVLRRECLKAGVKILDRTPVVKLVNEGGKIRGAIGFSVREDAWVLCNAKRTVLASGGCGFKGAYFGLDMATGDGPAMALEEGTLLMNMEFSNKIQTTHRGFDTYGMNRFVSQGAVFRNRLGERFMPRYEPELKDGASLTAVAKAIYQETKEGRAPIYFDLSDMKEENVDLSADFLKPLTYLIENSGTDFYTRPQEWITSFTGSVGATPAGIWTDERYRTSLDGLYAIGDAASKADQLGACVGIGGAGMLYALVSANDVSEILHEDLGGETDPESTLISEGCKKELFLGLDTVWTHGIASSDDALYRMQEILFDLDCSFMKNEANLEKSVAALKKILNGMEFWGYKQAHGFVKCFETKHMILNGLAFLNASLARKESRGGHLRTDYPEQRTEFEKRSLISMKDDFEMKVEWECV